MGCTHQLPVLVHGSQSSCISATRGHTLRCTVSTQIPLDCWNLSLLIADWSAGYQGRMPLINSYTVIVHWSRVTIKLGALMWRDTEMVCIVHLWAFPYHFPFDCLNSDNWSTALHGPLWLINNNDITKQVLARCAGSCLPIWLTTVKWGKWSKNQHVNLTSASQL